jgi:hypothetical protein
MKQNLAGAWRFRIDPHDLGIAEQWYSQSLSDVIHLPGSLQEQGYGDEVTLETEWIGNIIDRSLFDDPRYESYRQPGNVKYPCWLQPERHYNGAAWIQRDIVIPADWVGQRVTLTLERSHWETTVWLDGRRLGSNDSLSTPHIYDLGVGVTPGAHRLTVRIDNRMIVDIGPNSHSISDHTQGNWNGVIGRIELAAESPVWMHNIRVFPHVAPRSATIKIDITSLLGAPISGAIMVSVSPHNTPFTHTPVSVTKPFHFSALGGLADLDLSTKGGHVDVELPLGDDAQTWDEFSPALYTLTIDLDATVAGQPVHDRRVTTFGLREIGVLGTQFTMNGQITFMRGTLECCIFPLTGYPPTDVGEWKRIIAVCKAHGLNQIRFHSWCPPEAAFIAADELGFYFQVECPSWANQGAALGEGRPLDEWLYREARRILDAYGNHPSFVLMAYGNEPAGRTEEFLSEWVTYWRKRDPRRLYTSGAGWPALAENDYHNIFEPRMHWWGAGLTSRINGLPPETRTDYRAYVEPATSPATRGENRGAIHGERKPIISHEIGQWCVHPNFAEMEKYSGSLKPKNFEIFRDFLEANHMGDQAHDFLLASGKLQTLCYKEEIESALRTPGFGGFNLLDLHDFPGQGTALVGVLDPFWEEKGYITSDAFRRFCNSTVPLALLDKRYWTTSETLYFDVRIAHFGSMPLKNTRLDWRLIDEAGAGVASGELLIGDVPISNYTLIGPIEHSLSKAAPAQKLRLVVGIAAENGLRVENDWDLWVFAETLPAPVADDLLVTAKLDEAARARLAAGGKVLFMPDPAEVDTHGCVLGFSSLFWNTAWTRNQAPHTLGILCDPDHPVFGQFPTESHSNWQWWELIHGAAALVLDDLPPALRPLVQPIDTWFEARRLGLLVEAQIDGGKLMVCSMDLRNNLAQRLVARQMLHSLLAYMASSDFAPQMAVSAEQIQGLLRA